MDSISFLSIATGQNGNFGVALRENDPNMHFDIYKVTNDGQYLRVNRKAFNSKFTADANALKLATGTTA